jgi:hypothetical protein
MGSKHFFDSSHGLLVDLPWMQIRRCLSVESEPPSTDRHDHDLLIR